MIATCLPVGNDLQSIFLGIFLSYYCSSLIPLLIQTSIYTQYTYNFFNSHLALPCPALIETITAVLSLQWCDAIIYINEQSRAEGFITLINQTWEGNLTRSFNIKERSFHLEAQDGPEAYCRITKLLLEIGLRSVVLLFFLPPHFLLFMDCNHLYSLPSIEPRNLGCFVNGTKTTSSSLQATTLTSIVSCP